MKNWVILSLGLLIGPSLWAIEDDLNTNVIGTWKIHEVDIEDHPKMQAASYLIGELELKADGTYNKWIQYQTNPPSSITYEAGKWRLRGKRFSMYADSAGKPVYWRVFMESDILIKEGVSDSSLKLYLNRKQSNLPSNVFEGIKRDYTISFPENWNLFTPTLIEFLSPQIKSEFIQKRLSALVISPLLAGNILLNVSSRELPLAELDVINEIPGRKLRTEEINGYKWTIQTMGKPGKYSWGYHASTYLNGGTIRLTFTFNSLFKDDSDEFLQRILSTFKPLK